MREIKGYVVRGKDRATGEACHHAPPLADRVGADGTLGYAPDQIDAAAWGAACLRRDSDDVRILAVAEDGVETPLPTYEEALDEVEQLCAEVNLARGRTMAALAEAERLRSVVDLARRLIRSADLNTTSGTRAGITCNEEPYAALVAIFEAEREAERLIPGLVCAECDRPIYKGQEYGGKGGHAAHKACRNWPKGTAFKVAGAPEGPAS